MPVGTEDRGMALVTRKLHVAFAAPKCMPEVCHYVLTAACWCMSVFTAVVSWISPRCELVYNQIWLYLSMNTSDTSQLHTLAAILKFDLRKLVGGPKNPKKKKNLSYYISNLAQLKDININSLVYVIHIPPCQMCNTEAASAHMQELGLRLPIPAMCYVNLST